MIVIGSHKDLPPKKDSTHSPNGFPEPSLLQLEDCMEAAQMCNKAFSGLLHSFRETKKLSLLLKSYQASFQTPCNTCQLREEGLNRSRKLNLALYKSTRTDRRLCNSVCSSSGLLGFRFTVMLVIITSSIVAKDCVDMSSSQKELLLSS